MTSDECNGLEHILDICFVLLQEEVTDTSRDVLRRTSMSKVVALNLSDRRNIASTERGCWSSEYQEQKARQEDQRPRTRRSDRHFDDVDVRGLSRYSKSGLMIAK